MQNSPSQDWDDSEAWKHSSQIEFKGILRNSDNVWMKYFQKSKWMPKVYEQQNFKFLNAGSVTVLSHIGVWGKRKKNQSYEHLVIMNFWHSFLFLKYCIKILFILITTFLDSPLNVVPEMSASFISPSSLSALLLAV